MKRRERTKGIIETVRDEKADQLRLMQPPNKLFNWLADAVLEKMIFPQIEVALPCIDFGNDILETMQSVELAGPTVPTEDVLSSIKPTIDTEIAALGSLGVQLDEFERIGEEIALRDIGEVTPLRANVSSLFSTQLADTIGPIQIELLTGITGGLLADIDRIGQLSLHNPNDGLFTSVLDLDMGENLAQLAALEESLLAPLAANPPSLSAWIEEVGLQSLAELPHMAALADIETGLNDSLQATLLASTEGLFALPSLGVEIDLSGIGFAGDAFKDLYTSEIGIVALSAGPAVSIGEYVTSTMREVTASIVDSVKLIDDRWLSEFPNIKLPSFDRPLCSLATTAVHNGDMEAVAFFTTEVCGLPAYYTVIVAEALWEGRWQNADEPIAYVSKVARNLMKKRSMSAKPLWHSKLGHLKSLDEPTAGGDPLGALVPDRNNPFKTAEREIDFHIFCRRANLPPEAVTLLYARRMGYTRQDVGGFLGWSQRKVERVWRLTNRRIKNNRNH